MGTVIAAAAVLAVAALAVRSLLPKKGQQEASSCGSGCSGCPHSGNCLQK